MTGRGRVVGIGLLWTGCVVALLGHLAWHLASPSWTADLPALTLTFLAFVTVGAVIVLRRPGNVVGWLFVAVAALPAAQMAAQTYARNAVDTTGLSWPVLAAACFVAVAWYPFFVLIMVAVPLLFPDGRLPSPRWRPVLWAALGCLGLGLVRAVAPGPLSLFDGEAFPASNPLGLTEMAAVTEVAGAAFFPSVMLVSLVAVGSLAVRYRRAEGQERRQITAVLLAVAAFLVVLVVDETLLDVVNFGTFVDGVLSDVVAALALAAVPVAAGVAVLQYRLYAIDVVLNRVVVYGCLAAAVTVAYAALLLAAGAVAGDAGGPLVGLVAVVIAAVAFQPARARLQRLVNRLTYGDREDPFTAMTTLLRRLETTAPPSVVLAGAAETLAHAFRFPFVAIDMAGHGGVVAPLAEYGSQGIGVQHEIDLRHQGETVGRLRFGLAPSEPALPPRHRRRVHDVARQLAGAVHAARLARDLQSSRERLVSAREEERRRLRRDLHDGLGSAMTGVVFKAEALAHSVRSAPEIAERLADEVIHDTQAALADLRRLVYDLRPPALDELGLVAAIRDQVDRLRAADGPTVELHAPHRLPPLPAAVEVAAYRVVTEALTNVHRHARAASCTVSVCLNGALEIEVVDDGLGVPVPPRPGVGLASMRERAGELGGTCSVAPARTGGTRVSVMLPVPP